MSTDQPMLSKFGAGDTTRVDLEINDSDGIDMDGRKQVRAYIGEHVEAIGWKLIDVNGSRISWCAEDSSIAKVYRLEKNDRGKWSANKGSAGSEDLQDAIDQAAEWIRSNPIEPDNTAETGGNTDR